MDRKTHQQNVVGSNQTYAPQGATRIHQPHMQYTADSNHRATQQQQQQMYQGVHGHSIPMTPNASNVLNIPVPSSCMRALSNPNATGYSPMVSNNLASAASSSTSNNVNRSNIPPATPQRSVSHPEGPIRTIPVVSALNQQANCSVPQTIPIPIPSAFKQHHSGHNAVASSWQNDSARGQMQYMIANRAQLHNMADVTSYHPQHSGVVDHHQHGSLPSSSHISNILHATSGHQNASTIQAPIALPQQTASISSQRSVSASASPAKSLSSSGANLTKKHSGIKYDPAANSLQQQQQQQQAQLIVSGGRHSHRHGHSRAATYQSQMSVTSNAGQSDEPHTAPVVTVSANSGPSLSIGIMQVHSMRSHQPEDSVSVSVGQSDSLQRGLLKTAIPIGIASQSQSQPQQSAMNGSNNGNSNGVQNSPAGKSTPMTNVVDIPFEISKRSVVLAQSSTSNANTNGSSQNQPQPQPQPQPQIQIQTQTQPQPQPQQAGGSGNLHASTWSLGSSASVMTTSSNEERNMQEVKKLRNELLSAQEKVASLTKQLSSNANIVSAFEKNLMVMSTRLQSLSACAAAKDDEVSRLRTMLDGLTASLQSVKESDQLHPASSSAAMENTASASASASANSSVSPTDHITVESRAHTHAHHSGSGTKLSKAMQMGWLKDSLGKAFSIKRTSSSGRSNASQSHARSSSHARTASNSGSVSDFESAMHGENGFLSESEDDPSRRDGSATYLTAPRRGSNAVSRQRASVQNSPMHTLASGHGHAHGRAPGHSASTSNLERAEEEIDGVGKDELRRSILEKDARLADLQLEALAATQQLAHYRDVINKMRNEISSLKIDNDRLYKITCSSLKSDAAEITSRQKFEQIDDQSLDAFASFDRLLGLLTPSSSLSPASPTSASDSSASETSPSQTQSDEVNIKVAVSLQQPSGSGGVRHSQLGLFGTATYATVSNTNFESSKGVFRVAPCCSEVYIGMVSIVRSATWSELKLRLKALFKTHLSLVDSPTSLGLSADSLHSFVLNDACVQFFDQPSCDLEMKTEPLNDLLARLMGDQSTAPVNCVLNLRSYAQNGAADLLAFESLIPKTILERYISLLTEHRRVILCGSADTGKSGLAYRLAEYLIRRGGKDVSAQSLVAFQLDQKSAKEVRAYLSQVVSACESQQQAAEQHASPALDDVNASRRSSGSDKLFAGGELPTVILLDNMHNVPNLLDLLNTVLSIKHHRCPYIIGTMNQRSGAPSSLQLHHNFRWILCANHMEPIKGLLSRTLRTRLIDAAVRKRDRPAERNSEHEKLVRISSWTVSVWQFVNRLIESYCTVDVTLGPRLFLSCPIDVANSQVWFTNLWNYSLVPYILEAIREGIQTFGRRNATPCWNDPSDFIRQTYPWRAEDPNAVAVAGAGADTLPTDLLGIRPEDIGYFESSNKSNVGSGAGPTRSSGLGLTSFSIGSCSPADAQCESVSCGNADVSGNLTQSTTNLGLGSAMTSAHGHTNSSNVADAVAQLLERMQSRVSSLNSTDQQQKPGGSRRSSNHLMTLSTIQPSSRTQPAANAVRGGSPASVQTQMSDSSLSLNAILSRARGDSLSMATSGSENDNLDEYFKNLLKH